MIRRNRGVMLLRRSGVTVVHSLLVGFGLSVLDKLTGNAWVSGICSPRSQAFAGDSCHGIGAGANADITWRFIMFQACARLHCLYPIDS